MTQLAQTAIDFCRLCLGWVHADEVLGTQSEPYVSGIEPEQTFYFTDLNAVMEMVQALVDEHPRMTWVRLHFDNTQPGFRCEIDTLDSGVVADVVTSGACHALLAACVEASRKLKATT